MLLLRNLSSVHRQPITRFSLVSETAQHIFPSKPSTEVGTLCPSTFSLALKSCVFPHVFRSTVKLTFTCQESVVLFDFIHLKPNTYRSAYRLRSILNIALKAENMSSAHACTSLRGNTGLQTLRIWTLLFCLTAA